MRVTETELNLKSGVVDVEHVDSPHRGVGREVEPVQSVSQDVYHQLDIAPELQEIDFSGYDHKKTVSR